MTSQGLYKYQPTCPISSLTSSLSWRGLPTSTRRNPIVDSILSDNSDITKRAFLVTQECILLQPRTKSAFLVTQGCIEFQPREHILSPKSASNFIQECISCQPRLYSLTQPCIYICTEPCIYFVLSRAHFAHRRAYIAKPSRKTDRCTRFLSHFNKNFNLNSSQFSGNFNLNFSSEP